jgi:hypothetical protein
MFPRRVHTHYRRTGCRASLPERQPHVPIDEFVESFAHVSEQSVFRHRLLDQSPQVYERRLKVRPIWR